MTAASTATGTETEFVAALSALTVRLGFGEVRNLRHLSGGASKQTWAFDAGTASLVLRRDSGNAIIVSELAEISTSIPLETEAELMILAGRAGVPSPEIIHVLGPEDGLGVGFVMRHVGGEALGGRIVRNSAFASAREQLAFQCGEILARIHAISLPDTAMLTLRSPKEIIGTWQAVHEVEQWPRPVFDLAFQWLGERTPDVGVPMLVHGDFRNGNLLVGPDGVTAVLDWELAYIGDPMQDLGWLCTNSWRFGAVDKPVGGFGTREQLFAGYESGGGAPVDPERVRFWEIFGSLRWGVMCTMSTVKFRELRADGNVEINVDLPMIARRASETELDLVNLLRETV